MPSTNALPRMWSAGLCWRPARLCWRPARLCWRRLLVAVLLAALLLARTAPFAALAAGEPPPDNMKKINHIGGQGAAVTVDAAGQYAYFSAGPVLYAALLSDGQITHIWASPPLSGNIHKIEVVGGLAYLAAEQSGLLVLDISDKTNMHLVASYDTLNAARGLYVVEDLLYLAVNTDGLLILNVSDINSIALVNTLTCGPSLFNDVVVKNSFAYVAAQDQGMLVYEVSNPLTVPAPFQYDPPGGSPVAALDVQNMYAYLATAQYIRVVAISNPADLHAVGAGIDVTGITNYDVAISGATVYAASSTRGVCAASVNNPALPGPCTFYEYNHEPVKAVAVTGGDIFAATPNGLYITDPVQPDQPQMFALRPAGVIDAARSGDRLYLIDAQRLYVYNALDPTQLLGSTAASALRRIAARDVTVSGATTRYVYAMQNSGSMEIYDVTDPARIQRVNTIAMQGAYGAGVDFCIAQDTLYLLTQAPGYLISYNIGGSISDPAKVWLQQALMLPMKNGTTTSADGLRLVLAQWNSADAGEPVQAHRRAYATLGEEGLAVFDVQQPAAMTLLWHARFAGSPFTAVAVAAKPDGSPGTLYLAGSADIQILDADDLTAPRRWLPTRLQANDLLIADEAGDYLYAAEGTAGVTVFGLDDPRAPVMVGSIDLPGSANRLAASRRAEVYAIDEETGLQQVRLNLYDSYLPIVRR